MRVLKEVLYREFLLGFVPKFINMILFSSLRNNFATVLCECVTFNKAVARIRKESIFGYFLKISYSEQTVDAWADGGEEGRTKLR